MNKEQALSALIRPFEFAAKGTLQQIANLKGVHNTIIAIASKIDTDELKPIINSLLELIPQDFDLLPIEERHQRLLKGYELLLQKPNDYNEPNNNSKNYNQSNLSFDINEYEHSRTIINRKTSSITGVGPKMEILLQQKNIYTIKDLLYFFPRRYEDRRLIANIGDLRPGHEAYAEGTIITMDRPPRRNFGRKKRPYSIMVADDTGAVVLTWFQYANNVSKRFSKGDKIRFFGKVSLFGNKLQIVHPQIEHAQTISEEENSHIIPRYPEIHGINPRILKKIVRHTAEVYSKHIKSPIPIQVEPNLLSTQLSEAVRFLHMPDDSANVRILNKHNSIQHKRIAFEEIFFLQLAFQWLKAKRRQISGISYEDRRELINQAKSMLKFDLTSAQERVVEEIISDLLQKHPMNRLLQGDVGSGKTIVALLTSLLPIANEAQVAIMVPTEVLAVQHATNASKLLAPLGVSVDVLISGMKAAQQKDVKQRLKYGDTDIIIGTHALIYSGVEFKRLGLVIIDEQHRFGVEQRAALKSKGVEPDLLVMTATPIPRTLAHAFYGDLDISVLDEMPPGRKPIITELVSEQQRNSLYKRIRKFAEQGMQVYIVYPRIDETDDEIKGAIKMFDWLSQNHLKGITIGLLHGRMSMQEKQNVVRKLQNGEIKVLISTTVIEVGIDVPNATVMVIEHADIFGLSQIHQLRGRVGRGGQQGYCFLITGSNPSEMARKRLEIVLSTNNGFEIAEEDFKLRGPGEYLGAKQSGMPDELLVSLIKHSYLIEIAKTAAERLLLQDPTLSKHEHQPLRNELMYYWGEKLKLVEA